MKPGRQLDALVPEKVMGATKEREIKQKEFDFCDAWDWGIRQMCSQNFLTMKQMIWIMRVGHHCLVKGRRLTNREVAKLCAK